MNELKVPKQVLCDFLITNGVKNKGALVSHIKTNYGIREEYLKAIEDKLTYLISTFEQKWKNASIMQQHSGPGIRNSYFQISLYNSLELVPEGEFQMISRIAQNQPKDVNCFEFGNVILSRKYSVHS